MQATEVCSKLHAIWTGHAGVHVIVCDVLIPYFIHCLYVPGISVNSQCIETRDSWNSAFDKRCSGFLCHLQKSVKAMPELQYLILIQGVKRCTMSHKCAVHSFCNCSSMYMPTEWIICIHGTCIYCTCTWVKLGLGYAQSNNVYVCVHETHCTCHKNSYSIASVDCTFPSSVFSVVYLYVCGSYQWLLVLITQTKCLLLCAVRGLLSHSFKL